MRSDETAETILPGNAMGDVHAGGAPKNSWILAEIEPGDSTATVTNDREGDSTDVVIVIDH